jgi:hypothetical protein
MTISLCDSCQTETTRGKDHVNTNCFDAKEEKMLARLVKTAGAMAKIEQELQRRTASEVCYSTAKDSEPERF